MQQRYVVRSVTAAVAMVAALAVAAAVVAAPASAARRAPTVDLSRAAECDFLLGAGQQCVAPFPNDYFTTADRATDTGRRLAFGPTALPANGKGVHIDPTAWNRGDGFSPGSTVIVRVPGLDGAAAYRRSKLVPSTDMARAFDRGQAAVVIDVKTGRRAPIWTELDAAASTDAARNLLIRPARNYLEGHRYVVALRTLRDASGRVLQAPAPFRIYRDRLASRQRPVERRRAHMERLFAVLRKAGIDRRSLYAAWDFTVASERGLSERMLHIRDDAFRLLGDRDLADGRVAGHAPAFTVTSVKDFAPCDPAGCQDGQDPDLRRQVQGTYDVPCYLDQAGCPPRSGFALDANGLPVRTPGNVMKAKFVCNVPWSAAGAGGVRKLLPALYGHGLFGDYTETKRSRNVHQLGDEQGVLVCGTDWSGMASEDVQGAIGMLLDLSRFSALTDRLQQGFVNFMYLGRLLRTTDGFARDDAFRIDGQSVVDTSTVGYYGNSQGGIMGGALTALSPDVTRSVLYVPGMTYSILLPRSVDFDEPGAAASYANVLYGRIAKGASGGYPDEAEHPLVLGLMQLLWDRGEPSGYAQHMTNDPLPNTPKHHVLIEMAIGDHQVANIQAEAQARTIGARMVRPGFDAGRSLDRTPGYGLGTLGALPRDDNAIVPWDIGPLRRQDGREMGTTPPPADNRPNTAGQDPHDYVIGHSAALRRQIAEYLRPNGRIVDVCGGRPCRTPDWTG